jgi:hypothetical protein
VFVWITCIVLCSTITISWYIGLTLISSLGMVIAGQLGSGQDLQVAQLVQYVSIAWGPLFDIIVVIWAIVSSQARDIQSEMYG